MFKSDSVDPLRRGPLKKNIEKKIIKFYLEKSVSFFPQKEIIKDFFPQRKIKTPKPFTRNGAPEDSQEQQDGIRIMDRISTITMKQIADYHYGEYPVPKGWRIPTRVNKSIAMTIEENKVIWVDTGSVREFLLNIYPLFKRRVTIISGDGDPGTPGDNYKIVTNSLFQKVHDEKLNKTLPKIKHWFAANCDKEIKEYFEDRFTCIPIGLSQWDYQLETIQEIEEEAFPRSQSSHLRITNHSQYYQNFHSQYMERDIFLLANFRPTHPYREMVLRTLKRNKELSSLTVTHGFRVNQKTLWNEKKLYKEMYLRSKYILSPRGVGIDCYRHYEAIFTGAIPIMESSPIDEIFADLPVLIVPSLLKLNVSFLQEQYPRIKNNTIQYKYEKLYVHYWQTLIKNISKK